MDEEAISHHEVNKYQDAVETADPKGLEYMDADASFLT